MKEEIMQRFAVVLNALNNIDVKGKANLANLSGSIAILEEARDLLIKCEITQAKEEDNK